MEWLLKNLILMLFLKKFYENICNIPKRMQSFVNEDFKIRHSNFKHLEMILW